MFTNCVRAVCFEFYWCCFFALASLPILCLVFSHASLLTMENKSLGFCQVSNENGYLIFIFLSHKQNMESRRGGDFTRYSRARDIPLWLNLFRRWSRGGLCQLVCTGFMPMASQKRSYRNSNLNYWSCSLISKILLPSITTKMCGPFSGPCSKCDPILYIGNTVVKYCEPNQRNIPIARGYFK